MRRENARRLAELERRLLPPPRVYWSPWQRLLDDSEYAFVLELHRRGAAIGGDPDVVSTWHDDWPAWEALCADERERAIVASIRRRGAGLELWQDLLDLSV